MEKTIPTYYITIDEMEDGGIDLISLVENPAIMIKGLAFNNEQKRFEFKYDNDKQIIAGPAIIPDLPIYRYDDELGEYYVVFKKETIEKMVDKFNQKPKQLPINLEHSSEIVPAFIKGSWIIEDSINDKSQMYGFTDLPVGTFFIEVKITDKEYWKKIKESDKTGFSIEGMMGLSLSQIKKEFEIIQGGVASSNVDSYRYNDVSGELILTFNDGSRYRYYQIDKDDFESIVLGDAECITEGENEYGRWFIGKSPSVGAAVWQYLIDKGVRYQKLTQDVMTFESYNDYPKAASENACKVLRWRDEHGDEVQGMTQVGWVRANQLCNGENISEETIARMSGFQRHKQNSEIAEEYKGTPWKDRGYVAWLGWGGTEGIEWASNKLEQIRAEMSFAKISFDIDGVLTTSEGKDLLQKAIDNGDEIFVISARNDESKIWEITDKYNIPHSRIFATGSNNEKVIKIKELGIDKHYDDNPDVIAEIGKIGIKLNKINKNKTNMKKLIFRDYKLKDGDMITIDGDMAIGSSVYLIKEDGTRESAPEGEYILEDDTTIFVDAEGYINEVRTAATSETEAQMETEKVEYQVTPEEVMAVVNPIFEEMRAIIGELQARVEMLEGNIPKHAEEEEMEEFSRVNELKFKLNRIRGAQA